jgi:hypothetical protein
MPAPARDHAAGTDLPIDEAPPKAVFMAFGGAFAFFVPPGQTPLAAACSIASAKTSISSGVV